MRDTLEENKNQRTMLKASSCQSTFILLEKEYRNTLKYK